MVGAGVAGAELCAWVDPVTTWSSGQRSRLRLNIEHRTSSWNVTLSFDRDVTFEVNTANPRPILMLAVRCAGVEGICASADRAAVLRVQQVLQRGPLPLPGGRQIPGPS